MSTGAEHYAEAGRLLKLADRTEEGKADVLAAAQVHATLAAAAAAALPAVKRYYGDDSDTDRQWAQVTA